MVEKYDVVIIGAGPAGLLLGKELSKKHSILILEKNKIGETDRSWITYMDRWRKNKFPKSFVENKFNKFHFKAAYEGKSTEFFIKDNYIGFNEHKFLNYLAKIIEKNGGKVLDNNACKEIKRKNDHIIVNNEYSTKLLVDCAGVNSPIIKKFSLIKLPLYLACYGYIGEFKENLKNNNYYAAYQYGTDSRTSFFGFTKISPNKAFIIYFAYNEEKIRLSNYKKRMEDALQRFSIPENRVVEWKRTIYPSGFLKKRSLDNIFLFGDAGFYSPCFTGMGFNEILRQHKRVAKHLSKCIRKNKYSEKDIGLHKKIAQDIDNKFFQIIGLFMNSAPIDLYYKTFSMMNKFPNIFLKRVFRNTLRDKDIIFALRKMFSLSDAKPFIKSLKKEYVLSVIKLVMELDEELLTEEVHNLIFKHHKISIHELYN